MELINDSIIRWTIDENRRFLYTRSSFNRIFFLIQLFKKSDNIVFESVFQFDGRVSPNLPSLVCSIITRNTTLNHSHNN